MENFVSFNKLASPVDYFYSKSHFVLLLISLVIIIFFSMYIARQRLRHQKIFVFVIGIILLLLEIARIYWRYKFLQYNKESLDLVNVTQLDMFVLSLWISIPLVLVSPFLKKKKKNDKSIFGLNFVYSISGLFAIVTLIYPININTFFEFYHCSNIIYILSRSFIIMLGLIFCFSKWIFPYKFLELWKAILSLIIFGGVCVALYYIFGQTENLFFVERFPLFYNLGFMFEFPAHYFVLYGFLFVFQLFLYFPFMLFKKDKFN